MHRARRQGDTADSLLSDGTAAAAAYVALTRGRYTNTIHIVAGSIDEGREHWVAAAGRPRSVEAIGTTADNIARNGRTVA